MTTLENEDLLHLLRGGESDRVEFKESQEGQAATSTREAICAFANDLPGHRKPGVVFVGVQDDGTLAGLVVTDELIRRLADMKTDGNIVPPPSMTVQKWQICDRDVAVITVQPRTLRRSAAEAESISAPAPGEGSPLLKMSASSLSDAVMGTRLSTYSRFPLQR